ncbi:MAG TPA: cytochrome c3 family protein, partial [Polyangiaceae bacterium]
MTSARQMLLLMGALVTSVAAACAEQPNPRFPHWLHLAKLECGAPGKSDCLSCNSCHAVFERDRAHRTPGEKLCARCHRDDAHELRAVLSAKPDRPFGEIAFGHDRHLSMPAIRGQCVQCHKGVLQTGGSASPPMSECFQCHEHEEQYQRGQCVPCHRQSDVQRLLPQTFLRHEGPFMRRHGQFAMQQKQLCQACHSEASCDSCHDVTQELTVEKRRPDRIQSSFVHRGDFMLRHDIEARAQPSLCTRCHAPETCDGCHVARGVSGNVINGRNPHPPGWVGTNPNTQSFHGREARRDI